MRLQGIDTLIANIYSSRPDVRRPSGKARQRGQQLDIVRHEPDGISIGLRPTHRIICPMNKILTVEDSIAGHSWTGHGLPLTRHSEHSIGLSGAPDASPRPIARPGRRASA